MDKNELRIKNTVKFELQKARLEKIETKIGTVRLNRNLCCELGTIIVLASGAFFIKGPDAFTPFLLASGCLNLGLGMGLTRYINDLKEEQHDIEEELESYEEDIRSHMVVSDNSKVKIFTNRTNH